MIWCIVNSYFCVYLYCIQYSTLHKISFNLLHRHHRKTEAVTDIKLCVCYSWIFWLVLGWFLAADRHWCWQRSRHQLVLRLWHCSCFHKVKGSQRQILFCWINSSVFAIKLQLNCKKFTSKQPWSVWIIVDLLPTAVAFFGMTWLTSVRHYMSLLRRTACHRYERVDRTPHLCSSTCLVLF